MIELIFCSEKVESQPSVECLSAAVSGESVKNVSRSEREWVAGGAPSISDEDLFRNDKSTTANDNLIKLV